MKVFGLTRLTLVKDEYNGDGRDRKRRHSVYHRITNLPGTYIFCNWIRTCRNTWLRSTLSLSPEINTNVNNEPLVMRRATGNRVGGNMGWLEGNVPRFSALAFMSWKGLGPRPLPPPCGAGECREVLLWRLMVGSRDTKDALCLKLEDSGARLSGYSTIQCVSG